MSSVTKYCSGLRWSELAGGSQDVYTVQSLEKCAHRVDIYMEEARGGLGGYGGDDPYNCVTIINDLWF